jgi:hypothetical protein
MIKYKNVKQIDVNDWDKLVSKTYGRTYSFQQQDGCKERQSWGIIVPVEDPEDYENDTVPEIVNHEEMGVSFEAWLKRDPEQKLSSPDDQESWSLALWWERNFYPNVDMIINDLHSKGLLEAGEYEIDINW